MMNFEKALLTLVNNLNEVTVGEGKEKATYLNPTSEARQVLSDVKKWESYKEVGDGVKYAAKYNANQDGYNFGPFDTIRELLTFVGGDVAVAVFEIQETTDGSPYPSQHIGDNVNGEWVPLNEI